MSCARGPAKQQKSSVFTRGCKRGAKHFLFFFCQDLEIGLKWGLLHDDRLQEGKARDPASEYLSFAPIFTNIVVIIIRLIAAALQPNSR